MSYFVVIQLFNVWLDWTIILCKSLLPQSTPPLYDVTKLAVPTFLFTGGEDLIADPQDVAGLIPKIQGVIKNHINIPYYEHLDFIWGIDAATKVYKVIIDDIKKKTVKGWSTTMIWSFM